MKTRWCLICGLDAYSLYFNYICSFTKSLGDKQMKIMPLEMIQILNESISASMGSI